MNVLGIETSCDETAAAVVTGGLAVRSNIIASQADLHARYGGVVPEVASRLHVERLLPVISDALVAAGITYHEIHGIAVTNRPGLAGALIVGVSAAKALSYALKVPVTPVHHLEGHVYSCFLETPDLLQALPVLVLIVSGGHTQLVSMQAHGCYRILGSTRDDAAGEAFDKGARLLGLPYPGGPALAALAASGDPGAVAFPRAWLGDSLDFSFSGVKTALRNFLARDGGATQPADIAAGYQAAIVDVLTAKLRSAAQRTGVRTACIAGGVAANDALRLSVERLAAGMSIRVVIPRPELCTDNAAMIAAAGFFRLETHGGADLGFGTFATEPLDAGEPACA